VVPERVTDGAKAGDDAAPAPARVPPSSEGPASFVARARQGVSSRAVRTQAWLGRRRKEALPFDLAVRFYERDRDSFASVLGAAIALRLFLFIVPTVAMGVGLLIVIRGRQAVDDLTSSSDVTGGFAAQIESTVPSSRSAGWGLFLTGLVLMVWAGRSLTKVLASCAAGAWALGGYAARTTLRMAAAVTTLVLLLYTVAAVMSRIQASQGIAVVTTSWVVAGLGFGVGWFAVSWTLPRATRDPGALLPGAAVVGLAFASLQWFMQFYLPGRIERASEFAGNLGWTIATLGYMFLIGRTMASSLILNATVWERLGSISTLVFSLPVLRRIPVRFPSVARFFDLQRGGSTDDVGTFGGGGPDAPPVTQSATSTESTS
jgi:hypothetical protein